MTLLLPILDEDGFKEKNTQSASSHINTCREQITGTLIKRFDYT